MKASRIILVMVDTLRADRLGCYGYARPTTPNLDALASEGVVFKNAFTPCTYTVPVHASVLTGRYPGGLSAYYRQNEGELDADREIMLQELLGDAGYAAAAFVSAHVLRKKWGFSRGFGVYDDETPTSEVNRPDALYRRGEETTGRFLDWLRQSGGKDFFAMLHYFDVHGPYGAPEPFLSSFDPADYGPEPVRLKLVPEGEPGGIPNYQALDAVRGEDGGILSYEDDARVYLARYDAGVAHMDRVIGSLVAGLKEEGVYDDAAIIVASDHGEALGEGGVWFFHGLTVTPEQARVPLVVKLPGGALAGETVQTPVSSMDIMPTALMLAGVDASGLDLDAEPLFEWGEGGPAVPRPSDDGAGRFIVCENEWQRAVVHGDYLMLSEKGVVRDGFTYYFDSKELCRGEKLVRISTGEEPSPAAGPMDEAAVKLKDFSGVLSTFVDPREVAIRLRDIEASRMRARMDEMAGAIRALEARVQLPAREPGPDKGELEALRARAGELGAALDSMTNSYSWRITAPLRWLSGKVKRSGR